MRICSGRSDVVLRAAIRHVPVVMSDTTPIIAVLFVEENAVLERPGGTAS